MALVLENSSPVSSNCDFCPLEIKQLTQQLKAEIGERLDDLCIYEEIYDACFPSLLLPNQENITTNLSVIDPASDDDLLDLEAEYELEREISLKLKRQNTHLESELAKTVHLRKHYERKKAKFEKRHVRAKSGKLRVTSFGKKQSARYFENAVVKRRVESSKELPLIMPMKMLGDWATQSVI